MSGGHDDGPGTPTGGNQLFEELYAQHAPALLRYLRRLTGSMVDARDLLQDTFLRLWLQPDPAAIGNARAWLWRVATNLAQNHARDERRLRQREHDSAASAPAVSSAQQRMEAHSRVERALGAIDARGRRVLLLFAEGFTYREISSITGIEPGYVGVIMQRARGEFRRHFESTHAAPVQFKRRLS